MKKVAIVLSLFFACNVSAGERLKRPMEVVKNEHLGLEVWVEHEPAWQWQVVQHRGKPQLVVQSPEDYYPPVTLTYMTFPEIPMESKTLAQLAQTALQTAAGNYQATAPQAVKPVAAQYGAFSGYEAIFTGWANNEQVDVKVFVGGQPGRSLVLMQAYTLAGKLSHISEPLRRAWGNVKYLPKTK